MPTYETTTTVEELGQIHVADVPFEPGTRVAVSIRPAENGTVPSKEAESSRGQRLLAALDKARNRETVGPLRRDELYDRDILS